MNYAVSAAEEIKEQLETVKSEQIVTFEKEILDAKRVFVCAAGRSLLAMKFFAMRLIQFEIVTYLVGEVCTPSIGKGDLLIVGSGSGSTPTMYTVAEKAKKAGARVALVTLNSEGKIAQFSDCVVQVGTRKIPESAMKYEEYDRDNFITVHGLWQYFRTGHSYTVGLCGMSINVAETYGSSDAEKKSCQFRIRGKI